MEARTSWWIRNSHSVFNVN